MYKRYNFEELPFNGEELLDRLGEEGLGDSAMLHNLLAQSTTEITELSMEDGTLSFCIYVNKNHNEIRMEIFKQAIADENFEIETYRKNIFVNVWVGGDNRILTNSFEFFFDD